MKTVSTLVATSTVGLAACGLAVARPAQAVPSGTGFPEPIVEDDLRRDVEEANFEGEDGMISRDPSPSSKRLSNLQSIEPSSSTHRITLASPPSFSALTASSQDTSTPASSIGRGKRNFFRRLSESFSGTVSRSNSPYGLSPNVSKAGTRTHSRSGSRTASRQGRASGSTTPSIEVSPGTVASLVRRFSTFAVGISSRPATGTKSPLRRSGSRRAASRPAPRSQTPAGGSSMNNVSTPRRPSTFGFSSARKATRQSLFSSFGLETPTSTEPSTDLPLLRPYDPEEVQQWRTFFQPRLIADKTLNAGSNRLSSSTGSIKFYRRIYPNHRYYPTLVSPTAVSVIPEEEDFDSDEYIDCSESVVYYDESVPQTPIDTAAAYKRRSEPRRSLSLTGYIASNAFRDRRRRFTNSQTPISPLPRPVLESGVQLSEPEFETPPESPPRTSPIPESESSRSQSPHREFVQRDDAQMDIETERVESSNDSQGTQRSRRLSLMLSEHASTLIGSEDNDMMDFQSDTVFDSIRTRASPSHPPLGLDNIFNHDFAGDYILAMPGSPMMPNSADGMVHSGSSDRLRGLYKASLAERRNMQGPMEILQTQQSSTGNSAQNTEPESGADDEDDDDNWSEDWDVPLSPKPETEKMNVYSTSADCARESHSLTFPRTKQQLMQSEHQHHSRQSSNLSGLSSLDAFKRMSNDGTEDGRKLEIKIPKAGETPEVTIPIKKGRKRAPSTHLRSQSLPTVGKGIPSENWDDDFEDMNVEMVVPRAIEDAQKSVVSHLANVREFAAQIDELKSLYASAISKGIRFGASKNLWDEADSIIVLATVDNNETTIKRSSNIYPSDPFDDTPSNSSTESLPRFPSSSSRRRRNSVLPPDDDIFGAHDKTSSRTASPISKKVQQKNVWKHKNSGSSDTRMSERSMSEQIVPKSNAMCPAIFQKAVRDRGEKLHFDSTMLPELISYTKELCKDLKVVLEDVKLQNSSVEDLAKKVRHSKPEQLDMFDAWSGFDLQGHNSPVSSKAMDQKSPRDITAHDIPSTPADFRIPKSELVKGGYPTNTHARRKSRMGLEDDGTRRSSLMTFV